MIRKKYEYENPNNGGRERVYLENEKYFICSDFGNGFGRRVEVSKRDMKSCLEYTKAPEYVMREILGAEESIR